MEKVHTGSLDAQGEISLTGGRASTILRDTIYRDTI